MPLRGQRKFICAECGETNYLTWQKRARKFRPQCRWCGSYSLDPSPTSHVIEDIRQETENLIRDNTKEDDIPDL